MSFGQQSGPPASTKQIAYLLSLIEAEGYDFATGRHHYGFNQRQARGKFTVSEASEMIDMLVARAEAGPDDPPVVVDATVKKAQTKLDADRATLLRGIPAEMLADELERRGWAVIPPN
ncbi:MAG: hypothetical protein JWM34_1023 [Ilumatobacteraceae bacterium]|nr:hypothetical protein [Ilumatobacteraceae bacterium]